MKLTDEQAAILDYDIKPGNALKVEAYAGSGKTSTFVEYGHLKSGWMLYLAFQKSIQEEASVKFSSNVVPRTAHSIAHAAIGRKYKIGTLRYYAVQKLLKLDTYAATLVCMTLENYWNSAENTIGIEHVAEDVHKRYKSDYKERLVPLAQNVWNLMQRGSDTFPMTHGGYLKLFQLTQPNLGYATILADEWQDTNPVIADIVNKQLELYGAKAIAVGDTRQAIYGWRGAVNALNLLDGPTLHLTQSFRFGKNVATVANHLIVDRLGAQMPVKGFTHEDEVGNSLPDGAPHTIICRTNVEIFKQAEKLARKCVPLGLAGGAKFSAFLDGLMDLHYLWLGNKDKIKEKHITFFKSFSDLKRFAENRLDFELLSRASLIEYYGRALPNVIDEISGSITAPRLANALLTTAHSAKGLEWDNVMLADDFADLFGSKGDLLDVADTHYKPNTVFREEVNLLYVAATRAKKRLKLNHQLTRLCHYYGTQFQPANYVPINNENDEVLPF